MDLHNYNKLPTVDVGKSGMTLNYLRGHEKICTNWYVNYFFRAPSDLVKFLQDMSSKRLQQRSKAAHYVCNDV